MYPSITATGFFVSGFNWVVDYLISPIVMMAVKFAPNRTKKPMGQFLIWGLQKFSKPLYGTRLKVEVARAGKDGETVEKTLMVSHEDAYSLTAIHVAATVKQYLSENQSIRKPGLWRQAVVVDPRQLLLDMQTMGVDVEPRVV